MGKCRIAYENLLSYVDGRASAEESEALRRHLESDCAECKTTLRSLTRALNALRGPVSLHAPEAVLRRVRANYREQYRPVERVSLIARLIFDSRAELALSGARSVGDVSFHALYSTDKYDIDLWQEPGEAGRWYVIGQILPNEASPALIPLEASFQSALGETPEVRMEGSEFHIAAVLPGHYVLNLRLANQEITVPDILVGP